MVRLKGMSRRIERRKITLLSILTIYFHLASALPSDSISVDVDPNKELARLDHYWRSTGFCPPLPHNASANWFLSEDMTQNLIYLGSLPNSAIENVRIHFLLDAVTITGFKGNVPVYNFTNLDTLIDTLWSNGLKPGFEIMGNPSSYFTDFENRTQVMEFRRLVQLMAKRYISLYGLGVVQDWNFESWNEPSRHAFDTIKMTIPGFLNYYDACDIGLKDADLSLKLGAPGGELKEYSLDSYSWALLNHVVRGRNYFTGEIGTRVDFISIHKKGEEPDNTAAIFEKEMQTLRLLKSHLPELLNKPIYNDEADPLVTWSRDRWWRQDATYAAMVVKNIVSHQKLWLADPGNHINYKLLSNDNGFLSYNPDFFSERTLLARFQMNNTKPEHVQMIRKPIYTVMGLLSLLGEVQVAATTQGSSNETYKDVDILASVHHPSSYSKIDSWQLAVLLYNSRDSHPDTGFAHVTLNIAALLNGTSHNDSMFCIYNLDNLRGNPFAAWKEAGSPKTPTWEQLAEMRENEEPVRVIDPSTIDVSSAKTLELYVPLPGVALIHVCVKPAAQPDQVPTLSIHEITAGQILLYWDDSCVHTKCLRTYEVEFCPTTRAGPFVRINLRDTVFNSFVYAPDPRKLKPGTPPDAPLRGFYRARAVDYWGRAGEFSPTVQYSHSSGGQERRFRRNTRS